MASRPYAGDLSVIRSRSACGHLKESLKTGEVVMAPDQYEDLRRFLAVTWRQWRDAGELRFGLRERASGPRFGLSVASWGAALRSPREGSFAHRATVA